MQPLGIMLYGYSAGQADVIRRCGAGQVVPAFDHEGLARAIADAAEHPDQCREMGAAGRRFVAAQLAQRKILDRYAETLETMARGEIGDLPTWDPFP